MASVPGTSGSSAGRGNLPSHKRGQLNNLNTSNSESEQDSVDSGSGSDSSGGKGGRSSNKRGRMNFDNSSNPELFCSGQPGPVSSVMRAQPNHLKCQVCLDYPPMEVFQCKEGHIVCHKCITNLTRCHVCNAIYTQKKIRNRVAEAALDGMAFYCPFKNFGCLKTNILRHQRNSHDIQCDFNPSKPGFKLCGLFDARKPCQFRIDPNSIIQDPQHTKDVIEHLTHRPLQLLYHKIKIGDKISILIPLPTIQGPSFKPVVLFEVIHGTTGKIIGYYVLIVRLSQNNLSWAVVGLKCAPLPVDLNGRNPQSHKIAVKFSIKAKPDPNKVGRDGAGCVSSQNWTIKSTYLDEWKAFMMTPIGDRRACSFSLPVGFLSEHYMQEDDKYKLSVNFGSLN